MAESERLSIQLKELAMEVEKYTTFNDIRMKNLQQRLSEVEVKLRDVARLDERLLALDVKIQKLDMRTQTSTVSSFEVVGEAVDAEFYSTD